MSNLEDFWKAGRFASFDSEEFFDFQATRPEVKMIDGITRQIEWPRNNLMVTSRGREAVLLSGPEPNLRWNTFAEAVAELAKELKVELVVTMGALLADVPHSRPVAVSANTQDPTLVKNIGLSTSRYEGPTGIVGVLHNACAMKGLPSVSIWASVPHYLPSVPSAPAALALLKTLSSLLKVDIELHELETTARDYEEQVSEAVAQDTDLISYVRMVEERFDSQMDKGITQLPTGEELAAELEHFLREQKRDEPPKEPGD